MNASASATVGAVVGAAVAAVGGGAEWAASGKRTVRKVNAAPNATIPGESDLR